MLSIPVKKARKTLVSEQITGNISPAALVISIVPQDKGSQTLKAAREAHAVGGFIIMGQGTASADIWERLNITKYRDIALCTTIYSRVDAVMRAMTDHLDMTKAGSGITFAISIEKLLTRGMMKYVLKRSAEHVGLKLPSAEELEVEEVKRKVGHMMEKMYEEKREAQMSCPQELVIMRMANGYAQEVMDTARKAGAKGGTIIHGRSCVDAQPVKFFNITIEPESDILFMLISKDITDAVLESVAEKWGPHTPAHAFGFVVPVLKVFHTAAEER